MPSGPEGLLQLQRLAGNQAVSITLRKVPSEGTTPTNATTIPIQRVGGTKLGFDLLPAGGNADIEAGQKLLKNSWSAVRKRIHETKITTQQAEVQSAATRAIEFRKREKDRQKKRVEYLKNQKLDPVRYKDPVDTAFPKEAPPPGFEGGFTRFYAQQLTGERKNDQVALLKDSPPFLDGTLRLDDATGGLSYRSVKDGPYVDIGTLKVGSEAFEKHAAIALPPGVGRERYLKKGLDTSNQGDIKEYVKDSRGVPTRRYAYVEKNYYQMMEFFMTHKHEGRFQSYMRAAGEKDPNIFEHRDEGVDIVIPGDTRTPGQKLTPEQMAVAHQKLGSGPQQRGVSLTSTPKVGATYVNTGENFRTKRGFRLKIDLHKIPPDSDRGPLLINHYSGGGVVDTPATDADPRRSRKGTAAYPYKESSIHARELFLEYLKPEWIVEIEHHPDDKATGTTLSTSGAVDSAKLFTEAKRQFGGDQYEAGFNFGLTSTALAAAPSADYKEGFEGARTFVQGWEDGHKRRPKNPTEESAEKAKWESKGLTRAEFIYDQTIENRKHKGKHDLFRLGYLHGRGGKPMITSHSGLTRLGQ